MAEVTTLLAHLVPKLTSRVEDAATDALAFILNSSAACRGALDRLLQEGDFNPQPIDRVETQVTYQDGSRPDMVGYDRSGAKRLLVEAKFWASLQESQASRYFGKLEEAGPGLLLFIAPDSRIETLWAEIRRQMEGSEGGVQLESMETTDRIQRAKIAGSDRRVMLVSWDQLLGSMDAAVADDTRVACDIQQLRGLARYMDEEAFLPIHPAEFGLALPRRIRGLNRLIDDVVDANGVPQGWMTTKGLRATPQREGYGRYFRFTDASSGQLIPGDLFLCVNHLRWATSGDTPLWLWIYNKHPDPSNRVPVGVAILRESAPSLVEAGHGCDVPIYVKTSVEYESVVDDVVRQIREIADMIGKP